jgi:hypothetical protein
MGDHTEDALPSWNNGQAKQSILDFVKRVTTPGGEDFVPAAEREWAYDRQATHGRLDKGLDERRTGTGRLWT